MPISHAIPLKRLAPFQRWSGLVALFAFVVLSWLSVDSHAHASLHTDADHAEHACAVVDFAHGGATEASVAIYVLGSVRWVEIDKVERNEPERTGILVALPWSQGPPSRG